MVEWRRHFHQYPELSLKEAVDDYEKSLIEREWRSSTGKIAETARRLGISKQLLKYKLDKYRLASEAKEAALLRFLFLFAIFRSTKRFRFSSMHFLLSSDP
ncbi:helix-turn-helix domain-containing protein [Brevibacillus centrosporus]|uniref:Regulatory protein, Fis family n=1 Tax=Brevibacillus centrosporus TaxID=54910 RepID=A0A1I4DJX7_9BACL|nr:helix-turn-helix domain-containing protein [Brevibacillus centrosporus]MED4911279.1 helix-turn-helix domain-containing protein [Brevibacillus centrosporus]SFK92316.1 regulatory protein, Fis family [Brevibacillus centrosporus]